MRAKEVTSTSTREKVSAKSDRAGPKPEGQATYEMANLRPERTGLPPRPRLEDRTLCAFHQRNFGTHHCSRCQAPVCNLCTFTVGFDHLCPTCYEIAFLNREPWGR